MKNCERFDFFSSSPILFYFCIKYAFIENNHIIVQDAKVIVVVGYGFCFSIKDLIRIIVEWNESCLGERDHIEALCGPSYGAHYTLEKTMENIV